MKTETFIILWTLMWIVFGLSIIVTIGLLK